MLKTTDRTQAVSDLARDVCEGLSKPGQKTLPSRYFYDEVGSALFDVITLLPEYGLTRADERVLRLHARDIGQRCAGDTLVIELGSGSGRKTGSVLEAMAAGQRRVRYSPVDVSQSALEHCSREMQKIVPTYPALGDFYEGVRQAIATRSSGEQVLLLFLGSTIGNFDQASADELLTYLRGALRPGDHLLIGMDLVKPVPQLLAAYDDPSGVTAAFNLNLLARVNRELGANFDTRSFRHLAIYDQAAKRVEMHLRALHPQRVSIPGIGCDIAFRKGETIWTESSHKYTLDDVHAMAARNRFAVVENWVDQEWPFTESLWTPTD